MLIVIASCQVFEVLGYKGYHKVEPFINFSSLELSKIASALNVYVFLLLKILFTCQEIEL